MLHVESSLPSPRPAFALWLKENAHALTLGGGVVGTIVGGLLYFNGAIVSLKASNEANAKLLDSSLKASTEANAKLLDERIAHLDKTIANIAELARLNAEIESHKTLRDFKVSFAGAASLRERPGGATVRLAACARNLYAHVPLRYSSVRWCRPL
jgi:hypothetical protein